MTKTFAFPSGPQQGPAPDVQVPNVNMNNVLAQSKTVTCENPECGNSTFVEVFIVKHVSPLQDPNGKGGIAPIPVLACNACGHVNVGFLPSFMRDQVVQSPSLTEKV